MEYGLDWKELRCRGEIYYVERIDDDVLFIGTSTAWEPMCALWDAIIGKVYTDKISGDRKLSYVYKAEEPGLGLYVNTDESGLYFEERYYIYCADKDFEEHYGGDEEASVYNRLSSLTGVEINKENANNEIEKYNNEHPDSLIYFHKYDYE